MQVTSKSLACFITLLRTKEPLLKRTVIVACYVMGMPKKEIARKLQFSLSCVKRSIKKYQCNQPLTDKARCGRPRKLTTAGENRLCKMVHNTTPQRKSTRTAAANLEGKRKYINPDKHGRISISNETLRRILKARKLKYYRPRRKPRLTDEQRKKRKRFAEDIANELATKKIDVNNILFLDESGATVYGKANPITDGYWAENADEVPIACTSKRPKYYKFIGGISYNGLTDLVFYDSTLSAATYIELLERLLNPDKIKQLFGNQRFLVVHDGASAHSAHITCKWMEEHNIDYISCGKNGNWPSNSPDLNVIENLWALIKREARRRLPNDEKELKRYLQAAWKKQSDETIHNLVGSFPDRLQAVIKADGGNTRY